MTTFEASALQMDESELSGESVPAAKEPGTLSAEHLGPGDRVNLDNRQPVAS